MGCVESRDILSPICDADRFTSEPPLKLSSPVVRDYLLLMREKPGISTEYIIKHLKHRDHYESKEIDDFFFDEIYMGLTKAPSVHLFETAAGFAKLFDTMHHVSPFPHQLASSNAQGTNMADPFLLRRKSDKITQGTLFFSNTKGHQVMASRVSLKRVQGEDGKYENKLVWTKPIGTGLADCHDRGSAYPSVVEFRGKVFATGPANRNGTGLALFICKKYPVDWSLYTMVDPKASVMHATIVAHEERLYIFNTRRRVNEKGQHRLSFYSDKKRPPCTDVYFSDKMDAKYWEPHGHNPVLVGSDKALCGGAFLRIRGELFRMKMDCSLYYGKSVKAMHVVNLTPTEYEEEPDQFNMLSHVCASGTGFNSLGMHVIAGLRIGGSGGNWVGCADGFSAPSGWELQVNK